mmetsp:Transcript_24434/g.46304  ORF Transcript_24434/g.46304 Transcript_24434/m.46304 type:complete len:258 (+) Transcript_24434:4602-5375(+)
MPLAELEEDGERALHEVLVLRKQALRQLNHHVREERDAGRPGDAVLRLLGGGGLVDQALAHQLHPARPRHGCGEHADRTGREVAEAEHAAQADHEDLHQGLGGSEEGGPVQHHQAHHRLHAVVGHVHVRVHAAQHQALEALLARRALRHGCQPLHQHGGPRLARGERVKYPHRASLNLDLGAAHGPHERLHHKVGLRLDFARHTHRHRRHLQHVGEQVQPRRAYRRVLHHQERVHQPKRLVERRGAAAQPPAKLGVA